MNLINYLNIDNTKKILIKFHSLTGLPGIIIDNNGIVLAKAFYGNPLCMNFHKLNPETLKKCIESDTVIADIQLSKKDVALYKCKNGLYDVATRIIINGKVMGTLYSGQFFIEKPDLQFFRKQAEQYGFDKDSYMKAVLNTPVHTREHVVKSIEFLKVLAEFIGEMGANHKKNQEIIENELKSKEIIFEKVLKNTPAIIFNIDINGIFIFGEGLLLEKLGLKPNEFKGMNVYDIYGHNENDIKHITMALQGENINYISKNHGMVFNTNMSPYYDEFGNISGIIGVSTDLTSEFTTRKKLEKMSFHDNLSGLYNRYYLEEKMIYLDTPDNIPFSLIMGDINGLKFTNDVYGHSEGDNLIKKVAKILMDSTRSSDIVARWGGDEFVILLPSTDKYEARKIVERIYKKCKTSTINSNIPVNPSISLGIATKISSEDNILDILSLSENRMYERKLLESTSSFNSIITSLKSSLSQKSHETEEHADRLTHLCILMGKEMNFEINQLNKIELFAMLHDIGKITVDKSILSKKGPLTVEEWEEIKKHPETGFRIAQTVPSLSDIARYILYHHERWDGKGYPKGLKGEEIPLYCRVLSIVDAYDAMISSRPYSDPISSIDAIKELQRCSGTQFDPSLIKIFVKILKDEES